MKNNFRKFILPSILTLLFAVVFAVAVGAYTTDLMPKGVDRTDPDFVLSGYSDIDENDGWIMIAHSSANSNVKISQLEDGSLSQPKFCYGSGYRAYFHERMGKLVYLISSTSISGNWGDEKQSDTKNTDTLGARYYQIYWNTLNTEKVKTLELRLPTTRDKNYYVNLNHPGYATWGLKHHETMLYDYRIINCTYLESHISPFNHAESLVSAGHVEFNLDGSVNLESEKNTFTPGEVNLTAMRQIYSVSGTKTDFAYMLDGKKSVKRVIFFDSLVNKDGTDATYRVPSYFFRNCTSLREVVFPAELGSIGAYAFQNCSDLKLYLAGGFSDELSFDLTSEKVSAFNDAANITFVVNTYEDISRLRAILDALGITEAIATVECASGFEPALSPIGYTARTSSYNGIRGIFSFRPGVEAKNTAAGYTIYEYGVVACSLAKYNSFGGTPEAVYNTTNKAIKKMVVYGPANSANKYIDQGTKTFCLTVKSIGSAYYSSELCIFAYEKWITPEGETKIYYSQITDPDNPEQHWTTLYNETKKLVDSGAVTEASADYAKIIKPVLDSVATLAMVPTKREDYI